MSTVDPADIPHIEKLLPHSPPMVLIDRLESWSDGEATSSLVVRANTRFVENGRLPSFCLLEHMAQTVAACLGYEAYQDGEGVRPGMVVGCKVFDLHVDDIEVGTTLTIEVTRASATDGTSRFDCRTSEGETLVASATMTLVHGDLPD